MVGLLSNRHKASNVTWIPWPRTGDNSILNELMGHGKPIEISLEDLNPVEGLCLIGASIVFPLRHV